MPLDSGKKIIILYILSILRKYTDVNHTMTQQEIADRAGLTNQHINNLLSGKRKVESMKLETLLKLFPNAQIKLERPQIAGDNAIQVQGNVNVKGDDSAVVDKILNDDTLSAEEKVKVLKVLKK